MCWCNCLPVPGWTFSEHLHELIIMQRAEHLGASQKQTIYCHCLLWLVAGYKRKRHTAHAASLYLFTMQYITVDVH